jgi:hypothetical protein
MQDNILRTILPHHGIVFLPLSEPSSDRTGASPCRDAKIAGAIGQLKDCIRYSFASEWGTEMQNAFLGNLVDILSSFNALRVRTPLATTP